MASNAKRARRRVAVIGAGVVGALIARELSRYGGEVLLFEREVDVGWGVTKANSAIVHAGFHEQPGTASGRLCVAGNALFPEVCRELGVPFQRIGAYVLALADGERAAVEDLRARGEELGVPGLALLDGDEVRRRLPHVNPDVVAALWAPTVGITEPWALALAAVENAVDNGVALHLGEEVTGVAVEGGRVRAVTTGWGTYGVGAVVNAAGLAADRIAALAGVPVPRITPRRGEYLLLVDVPPSLRPAVLFPVPTPHSKGILVVPTVDGGLLLGPTAADLAPEEGEATETTAEGLARALAGARRLVPALPVGNVVKAFAGLRPEPAGGDFWLGRTGVRGFYQAAGMRSPGLTAAPAIARGLAAEIACDLGLALRPSFSPLRRPPPRVAGLPPAEWDALIARDPRYGRIVCRCNRVTEGEIVEAIRRGARTVDGVKFRTRAGFGRCQGGTCTDRVLALLARETGRDPEEVSVQGPGSALVVGRVR
ncbi:MAG: NAD(P)/FAD-dependent oxidoreductase [Candidatus Bipolaricaulota bacterium]